MRPRTAYAWPRVLAKSPNPLTSSIRPVIGAPPATTDSNRATRSTPPKESPLPPVELREDEALGGRSGIGATRVAGGVSADVAVDVGGDGRADRLDGGLVAPEGVEPEGHVDGEPDVVEVELPVVDDPVSELAGQPARGELRPGWARPGELAWAGPIRVETASAEATVSTAPRRRRWDMMFLPAAASGRARGSPDHHPLLSTTACVGDASQRVLRLAHPAPGGGWTGLRLRVSAGLGPAFPSCGRGWMCGSHTTPRGRCRDSRRRAVGLVSRVTTSMSSGVADREHDGGEGSW